MHGENMKSVKADVP